MRVDHRRRNHRASCPGALRGGRSGEARSSAILGAVHPPARCGLVQDFSVLLVRTCAALIEQQPDVVVEAASHEAVRDHAEALLHQRERRHRMSAGALATMHDARRSSVRRRREARCSTCLPAHCRTRCAECGVRAGFDEVTIDVTSRPRRGENIPYVGQMKIDRRPPEHT